MRYPDALRPTATEPFVLAGGRTVQIPKAKPAFGAWSGPPIQDTYGGKAVLEFEGEPLFAELVVLRHFESAGWSGAWIDTYRSRILTGLQTVGHLSPDREQLIDQTYAAAGSRHGCFDVFAWRGFGGLRRVEARRGRQHQAQPGALGGSGPERRRATRVPARGRVGACRPLG